MKLIDTKALLLGAAVVSCKGATENQDSVSRGDPAVAREARVAVAGARVTTAFSQGRLSASVALGSFAISKHPVTVAAYRACVDAGVCQWSSAACANPEGADDDVALCAGAQGAQAFCEWTGGKLPSLSEWLLAARGPAVRRFAWGDEAANCERHPRALTLRGEPKTEAEWETFQRGLECAEDETGLLRVAQHPAGASPFGLEDVLLSAGELLRGEASSVFSVCAVEERGCVVYGLTPGAISAVERVNPDGAAEGSPPVAHPYGFRCVDSEEVR